MTRIDVIIDTTAGTAQALGPLSNSDNVQLVLKGYGASVVETTTVRVELRGETLIQGGTVTVEGDDGICTLNTNNDAVKALAKKMVDPAQIGVEIVVEDTDTEGSKCSGRALMLLNWSEPGGGGGGGVPTGAVPITPVSDLPSRYRESDMRNKINELARIVSGRTVVVIALLAPLAALCAGVTTSTSRMDELYNDAQIVTGVVFSADGLVTTLAPATNYVNEATNALSARAKGWTDYAAQEGTNYTDALGASVRSEFASADAGVIVASTNYTDAATNALRQSIVVPDLSPYAQKSWVEAKGYIDSTSLAPYATRQWVGQQGYVSATNLAPYATTLWVQQQNYLTSAGLSAYATMSWVAQQGFLTSHQSISHLATNARVDALQSEVESGLASANEDIANLKRLYGDSNSVTRVWAPDGSEYIDGTGCVWAVTYGVTTNIVAADGTKYLYHSTTPTYEEYRTQGVVTNTITSNVGVGRVSRFMFGTNVEYVVNIVGENLDAASSPYNPTNAMSFTTSVKIGGGFQFGTYDIIFGVSTSIVYKTRIAYTNDIAGGGGSVPNNALLWENSTVRTKDGTKTVGAADVGALAAGTPVVTTNEYGAAEIRTVRIETWGDLQLGYGWGASGQTLQELLDYGSWTNVGAKAYTDAKKWPMTAVTNAAGAAFSIADIGGPYASTSDGTRAIFGDGIWFGNSPYTTGFSYQNGQVVNWGGLKFQNWDSISSDGESINKHIGTISTNVVNSMADSAVTAAVDTALSDILGSDWKTVYGGGLAGLIAALAAALTWLKTHKVGAFASVGGQTPTITNGTANLSSLFSNDNTTLASTISSNATVAGKITNPSGGSVGNVLKKTASGVEWGEGGGGGGGGGGYLIYAERTEGVTLHFSNGTSSQMQAGVLYENVVSFDGSTLVCRPLTNNYIVYNGKRYLVEPTNITGTLDNDTLYLAHSMFFSVLEED